MMYDELVKDLRSLAKHGTRYGMAVVAMRDAADAIEALSVIVREQKAVIDKLTQQLRVETENGKV